jgi:hypothetical protein
MFEVKNKGDTMILKIQKCDKREGIPVDVFTYVEHWGNEGYGLALISPDNIVVDPYIDPNDYPDMVLDRSGNGAKVIEGKNKGFYILFHSGILEELVGKEVPIYGKSSKDPNQEPQKSPKTTTTAKKGKKGKKYPKSEMKPYNPFAVCTESVGRDDKDKYERCIQHVKEQNKDKKDKRDKKAISSEDRLMMKVAANEGLSDMGRVTEYIYSLDSNMRSSGLANSLLSLNEIEANLRAIQNRISGQSGDLRPIQLANTIMRFKKDLQGIVQGNGGSSSYFYGKDNGGSSS